MRWVSVLGFTAVSLSAVPVGVAEWGGRDGDDDSDAEAVPVPTENRVPVLARSSTMVGLRLRLLKLPIAKPLPRVELVRAELFAQVS
jgi:hypothetical protein